MAECIHSLKGIQETSLVDYPPYIVSTLFLGGCNMRCPFCYNLALALHPIKQPTLDVEETLIRLQKRRGWIDGVCITGGEPTLSPLLPKLIERIKKMGLLVKLDTNGTNPTILQSVLPFVDYVAMDIKAPKKKYELACGAEITLRSIQQSIELLQLSAPDYEFRTTVVPALHTKDDLHDIGKWLLGSKRYFLQTFVSSRPMIDDALLGKPAYSQQEMLSFKDMLSPYFDYVGVR